MIRLQEDRRGHLWRPRCVIRGHVWAAELRAGVLAVRCGRCARQMSASLLARRSEQVDVTRDALELAAVVLAAGPQQAYQAHVDALVRTPRDSVQVLARLILAVADADALSDVRHMALMHGLRDVEAVQ